MRLILLAFLFAGCKAAVQNGSASVTHDAPAQAIRTDIPEFTHADTLRGSVNAQRSWWDVTHYDVQVEPDFQTKSIKGKTTITYNTTSAGKTMQIDLQQPLVIDSIIGGRGKLNFTRNGNVAHVDPVINSPAGNKITIYYHGIPREAKMPPWDGGWIWKQDQQGRPWMSVACQGLGASVWYPCKDHQSDEPDNGATLTIIALNELTAVGNGKLKNKSAEGHSKTAWTWEVKNPINTYNIIPYIGYYTHFGKPFNGVNGELPVDFWVLDYELEKARVQFQETYEMLACFEDWFGPYPFYEDGFKLVQSPHLGMEHQSAVAYGNGFQNGYLGRDMSRSGWGLKFDFILIHESGHEWFGNNITSKDVADMWVHEGFTTYSEVVFVNCKFGVQAANEYARGLRGNIRNDQPVIGIYGVQQEGSGDMYAKGAALVHTLRELISNDEIFKAALKEMNTLFWHQTVTTRQVEDFWQSKTSVNLRPVFDQYLRHSSFPALELRQRGNGFEARFVNAHAAFEMPVWVGNAANGQWQLAGTEWRQLPGLQAAADMANEKNKNLLITLPE